MINTKCAHCLFRLNDESLKQTGCSLGRLDKFIEQNKASILDGDDFYTIDRFCNTCRSEGYTKESILKEVEISCCFIVYGWNDYWITLRSILKQTIKPKVVYVVFDDMRLFNQEKYKEYQDLFNHEGITLIFKRYFEQKSFTEIIDDVVKKCGTQFYIPVKKSLPRDFIAKYNDLINKDLVQLNAHFKSTIFESFISCALHKRFDGNYNFSLKKKLLEFVKTLDSTQKNTIIFEE